MRLLDNLRNAEQRSVNAVRQRIAQAREEWGDVERRIRQRMRIYPQKLLKKKAVAEGEHLPEGQRFASESLDADTPQLTARPASGENLKPIVSVHGRDVTDDEFDHPAA